ncbi:MULTISPECIES: YczE/YyaS/YitT family protein [unclassified Jeotgalibaca]|uniref:YczE/YyaS/YitT family protein n=1 Tax=unclassified Jeotgalibaca TaxID=2621505 RepID=UPI003FD28879
MSQLLLKRVTLYIVGLFMLAMGVSLSIYANLGVSPVSSLSYAFSLVSGLSVGATTIFAHVLFIAIQIIIIKRLDLKNIFVQLVIAFLFGFFVDTAMFIATNLFPVPSTVILQWFYLILSLFTVAFGLFGYSNAQFTLMPYDELTKVISREYKMPFGKAKITGDISNVIVATIICLAYLGSLGSIGLGTIIASVSIGKIIGWVSKNFQKYMTAFLQEEELV